VTVPPAVGKGPRRPQTLTDEQLRELVQEARTAGAAAETVRQEMLTQADRRGLRQSS